VGIKNEYISEETNESRFALSHNRSMENFRLRVFRTVAHYLNFRMAAEELLLSQPAVSQQIKALESELSVPLFHRAAGRITLTAAGEALLPYAQRLKMLCDEAREAVISSTGGTAGQLSIGASQTIGQYLLPKLIATFLKDHPRVEISVTGGNTQTILDQLRGNRLQLALIEGPALGRDVRVMPFMEDHMVLVVPAGHEWSGQEVEVEDLKARRCLHANMAPARGASLSRHSKASAFDRLTCSSEWPSTRPRVC
jgi:DNA-binding transcriptional LysR family regulator